MLIAALLLAAQPAPVGEGRALLKRAEACLHFAGEESYDAARGREIDRGLAKARCDTIQREGKAFIRRHPKAPEAAKLRSTLADFG